MIDTIRNTPNRFKISAAVLAMAALAITVLAVTLATGPVWAGVVGTVPDPCGPGQDPANFPNDPAEVVSSGHYAIFDAYWLQADLGDDAKRTGTLNNNLCPPAAKHTEKTVGKKKEKVEETTLSPTNIDLRTTVIQVDNTHLKDVVATDAAAGDDKLSLAKYTEVREALGLGTTDEPLPVPAGTQVYWLRLEDDSLGTDPSTLVMGFSTGLLDGNYWDNPDGGPDFEYELEAVRYHGPNAAKLPHVLAYEEPANRNDNGTAIAVWDGLNTDVNTMALDVGEYEHLEWVFTQPGTYILEVHLKGHVRQSKPADAGSDWKKLTDEKTVSSGVKRYSFQVGPLTVNDSPTFGVERSVNENSAAGTKVGDPIKVFTSDTDTLSYSLTGAGADKFKVASVSGGAQITVANGAVLNKDSQRNYHLRLSVSDGKDHENNAEEYPAVDDAIVVQIHLVAPRIAVHLPDADPRVGDTVPIRASVLNAEGFVSGSATWNIQYLDSYGTVARTESMTSKANGDAEYQMHGNSATLHPGTHRYRLVCQYQYHGANGRISYRDLEAEFSINWLPASG